MCSGSCLPDIVLIGELQACELCSRIHVTLDVRSCTVVQRYLQNAVLVVPCFVLLAGCTAMVAAAATGSATDMMVQRGLV
jgi:hypothetical protein